MWITMPQLIQVYIGINLKFCFLSSYEQLMCIHKLHVEKWSVCSFVEYVFHIFSSLVHFVTCHSIIKRKISV